LQDVVKAEEMLNWITLTCTDISSTIWTGSLLNLYQATAQWTGSCKPYHPYNFCLTLLANNKLVVGARLKVPSDAH